MNLDWKKRVWLCDVMNQCHWLEENSDYIYYNQGLFSQIFHPSKILTDVEKSHTLVLLSPEGIIKLLSRSSKMKTVLFWLIQKFKELRLLKFNELISQKEEYDKKLKEVEKIISFFFT